MNTSRYPVIKRKSRALPPPVFPLLVSAVVSHNKLKEGPCTTAPDPQPDNDQVDEPTDTIALREYVAEAVPLHNALRDYAQAYKIRQRLYFMKYAHVPIEVMAARIRADPRLTTLQDVRSIGGISWEAHVHAKARVSRSKGLATVSIDPPHAEMRISPTHVYQFVQHDGPVTELLQATGMGDVKQFILNQDLLRISFPGFPEAFAKPGRLRVFTELDEAGEEMGVESRSAKGVLPVAIIAVPNLEGLEPVLQYCYRPQQSLSLLNSLLGEHFVDFSKSYRHVVFADLDQTEDNSLLLAATGLRVSRQIALSQPISLDSESESDSLGQLLLAQIRVVDAVAKVAGVLRFGCPVFWDIVQTARRLLFNAAVYRYQEAHKDKYPNRFKLEGASGTPEDHSGASSAV